MASYDEKKRALWKVYRARIAARIAASRQVSPEEIIDYLDSPDQLRAWLEAKPMEAVVGNQQTPDDTLLANYLWETLGVYVMTFGYSLDYDRDPTPIELELPAWCKEFYKVETERFKAHSPGNGDWTAAEALALLEEVERHL